MATISIYASLLRSKSTIRTWLVLSMVSIFAPHAIAAIDDSLIARYSLNEGGSAAQTVDVSGNGHTGALPNSASWVAGRFGQALSFNGTTQYVKVDASPALNPDYLTLTAWIKPDAVGGGIEHYIISKGRNCCDVPGQGGYGLALTGTGKLRGEVWRRGATVLLTASSTATLPTGSWTHVAMTFDGQRVRLYINGQADGFSPALSPAELVQPSTSDLTIGTLSYGAPAYLSFSGAIDEVRIHGQALSAVEIDSLYTARGGDPRLSFYEAFDDASTITANGGTPSGASLVASRFGKAVAISNNKLSFPVANAVSPNNIALRKGGVSFWFKPDWNGSDTATHCLFSLDDDGATPSAFSIARYYDTVSKGFLVARYDDVANCRSNCQVAGNESEPASTTSWIAGSWHFIEVMWDFTAANQFLAFAVDGQYGKSIAGASWDLTGFAPANFHIGSRCRWNASTNGAIDELKIYSEPIVDLNAIDYANLAATQIRKTRDDGIKQPHETIHNSPNDADKLASGIQPGETLLFFKSKPFESVYEGSVPDSVNILSGSPSIRYVAASGEYEPLFFNVYTRGALAGMQVAFGDFVDVGNPANKIDKGLGSIRVVKNWFQSGTAPTRSFLPVFTPELLLANDGFDFAAQAWSWDTLPSLPLSDHVETAMQSYTAKQFVIDLQVPPGTAPGIYATTVTVTSSTGPSKTLEIEVEVPDFTLETPVKDFVIYHRAAYTPPSKYFADNCDHSGTYSPGCDRMSEARYDLELADLRAHGINGLIFYGTSTDYVDKMVLKGFSGVLASTERSVVLKTALVNSLHIPYFQGVDEPNDSVNIQRHIVQSHEIHTDIGGKVLVAIRKSWADKLRNPNDAIYGTVSPKPYEPLDYANLDATATETQTYFQQLINGSAIYLGSALQLNGSNQYAEVTDPADKRLDPGLVSVSAWIRPAAIDANTHYIVSKDRNCCAGQGGYGLSLVGGVISAEIWKQSDGALWQVTGSGTIAANTWTHVAMTFDQRQVRIYVNGALYASSASLPTDETVKASTLPLTIGKLAYQTGSTQYYFFNGAIDDVRIYGRTLPQTDVAMLAAGLSAVPSANVTNGLVGYYAFNEEQGSWSEDRSGTANTAVLKNAAGWTDGPQEREGYYWQSMLEDPRSNRYHAGFLLWVTGLDGVLPYVYQHVYLDPYNDFDPGMHDPIYRDHLTTYPSQQGPVPTMQWLALREGIDDYRYLLSWRKYWFQAQTTNPSLAACSKTRINSLLQKYRESGARYAVGIGQYNDDRNAIRSEIKQLKNCTTPVPDCLTVCL